MDPRIRQIDIIMREEASVERLRMNDQRYINLHLSTPGYRTYRPAVSNVFYSIISLFIMSWGPETSPAF